MNINITIYEGNNTLNVSDYTPTVTLTVVENLYQSGGGGAVNSVNGKTGTVVLGANDINESSTRFWLTDVLKSAYDGAVSAIANIYTKAETDTLLNNKVDKVSGKGLSQNDFTNDLKASYDGAVSGLANKVDKVTGYGLSKNDLTDLLKSTYDGYASQISAKANVSEVAIVLFKSITPTIITGKTVENSIYSIPLPTDGGNYIIRLFSQAQITTFAGSAISHKVRLGSYASPIDGASGANAIGNQTFLSQNGASTTNNIGVVRNFVILGGVSGSILGVNTASNVSIDESTLSTFSTIASKDFTTQQYLYITFNANNATASILHNFIYATIIKI